MSLPPALLQRLAQRGLVQKPKKRAHEPTSAAAITAENEEVIAEDYDELDADDHQRNSQEEYQYPSQYETEPGHKRVEENFWLERIKTRMGEAGSTLGYRGCPNKYNIWHKCTLYCVNRWADGKPEPRREYMRRYRRLLRKYPLPKGWSEMYDAGCGCYYFLSITDNLVSWLPPTHPKSQVTKSAAAYRRQMEDTANGEGGDGGSDGEQHTDGADDQDESEEARHHREIDDIITSAMRPRTPATVAAQDYPSVQNSTAALVTATAPQRKQKSRDLDRTIARQRREREKERERGGRRRARGDADPVDPMDPAAYSDIPRGKWSDGLNTGAEERKKSAASGDGDDGGKERTSKRGDKRAKKHSSDDDGADDDKE